MGLELGYPAGGEGGRELELEFFLQDAALISGTVYLNK